MHRWVYPRKRNLIWYSLIWFRWLRDWDVDDKFLVLGFSLFKFGGLFSPYFSSPRFFRVKKKSVCVRKTLWKGNHFAYNLVNLFHSATAERGCVFCFKISSWRKKIKPKPAEKRSTALLLTHNSSKSQRIFAKSSKETICQVILAHFVFRLLSTGAFDKVHSVLYLTLACC